MRKLIATALVAVYCAAGMAADPLPVDRTSGRIGLGQDTAKEPPQLRNLHLDDSLVQKKFVQDPDLMRFLRGTYSEACSRGILAKGIAQTRFENAATSPEAKSALAMLQDGKRIWKMTSFEMETLFGEHYVMVSNFCDCLMKEVSDADLANPKRGLDVIEKLPQSRQTTCQNLAKEQTADALKRLKK